jgi:hypothetical protein
MGSDPICWQKGPDLVRYLGSNFNDRPFMQ